MDSTRTDVMWQRWRITALPVIVLIAVSAAILFAGLGQRIVAGGRIADTGRITARIERLEEALLRALVADRGIAGQGAAEGERIRTAFRSFAAEGRSLAAADGALGRLDAIAVGLAAGAGPLDVREQARVAEAVRLLGGEARQALADKTAAPALAGLQAALVPALYAALALGAIFFAARAVMRPLERALLAGQEALEAERERVRAAEEAKRNFLSVVSHELRTPLNGILGFASLLLAADGLRPEHRRQVEVIHASGKALLALVNQILDLARLDAGALEIEDQELVPEEVISEVVTLLHASAMAKGLEMSVYIDPELGRPMRGDPNRLRQIVTNLLGNAIKFTERGSVAVEARLVPADEPGKQAALEVTVSDTGIGIPADKREHIFERFSRIGTGSGGRAEGSGLGLAICREVAARMGGRIEVESAPGAGSRFTLRVPCHQVPDAEDGTRAERDARFAGRRILVVDDNAINRRLCRLQLEAAGAMVDEAAGTDEAIALLEAAGSRAALPEMLVIDHVMPGSDGPALARRLRGDPRFCHLGLVLSSSGMRGGTVGTEGVFDAVVEKPVLPEALYRALADAANRCREAHGNGASGVARVVAGASHPSLSVRG